MRDASSGFSELRLAALIAANRWPRFASVICVAYHAAPATATTIAATAARRHAITCPRFGAAACACASRLAGGARALLLQDLERAHERVALAAARRAVDQVALERVTALAVELAEDEEG